METHTNKSRQIFHNSQRWQIPIGDLEAVHATDNRQNKDNPWVHANAEFPLQVWFENEMNYGEKGQNLLPLFSDPAN